MSGIQGARCPRCGKGFHVMSDASVEDCNPWKLGVYAPLEIITSCWHCGHTFAVMARPAMDLAEGGDRR